LNTCIECNSGFYFKSGVCTEITGTAVINNCVSYNPSASSVQCTECGSSYYLVSNSCTLRDKSADNKITNCSVKAVNADRCSTCKTGYYLTNDGFQCIPFINNCKSYNSTASGQNLLCNSCNDSYYLNTRNENGITITECLKGNIQNCSEYSNNNPDSCVLCSNGYLLVSNACVAHNNISSCTLYSTSNLHTCETCDDSKIFNFELEDVCQKYP